MNAPVEPHGEIREGAATMYQFYVAYIQAGFSEEQAFKLVLAMVAKFGGASG